MATNFCLFFYTICRFEMPRKDDSAVRYLDEEGDDDDHTHDDTSTSFVGELLHDEEGIASTIWYPIFDQFEESREVVAALAMTVKWDSFIDMALVHDANDIRVVYTNDCGQAFTFEISESNITT